MKKYITKKQAEATFKSEILPGLPQDDKIAINTAWHMFIDMLCKDGEITQYKYANWSTPAFAATKKYKK